jgi:hypothetical protein
MSRARTLRRRSATPSRTPGTRSIRSRAQHQLDGRHLSSPQPPNETVATRYRPRCRPSGDDGWRRWSRGDENDQAQPEDRDVARGPARGYGGRLFLRIDVSVTDRGAGLQASKATNIDVPSHALASVAEAGSVEEAIIRAAFVEAARHRSRHPEGRSPAPRAHPRGRTRGRPSPRLHARVRERDARRLRCGEGRGLQPVRGGLGPVQA